jgi:hypothetical protein
MAKAKTKVKTLTIKILKPIAGKYLMSDNVGDIISIDADQAAQMVENHDAEIVEKIDAEIVK